MDELNLPGGRRTTRLIAVVIAVAALYWARGLLIPLALAVLFSFLLYPLVAYLRRRRIPNGIAVTIVVLLAVGIVGGVGYVVSEQAIDLTSKLPDYQQNLQTKIRNLKGSGGTISRIQGTLRELQHEFASSQPTTSQSAINTSTIAPNEPMQVQMIGDGTDVIGMVSAFVGPLVVPLASLAVSFVFLIFILLGTEELRDRIVWFAGARQISLTTSVIDDIGDSISRFLRMQLIINASYGVLVAVALLVIGVPNALLWGLTAGLLRYVPYIGPWIATAMPTLLSIAIFQGWSKPLVVVAAFIACEGVCSMVLEPWLYSASMGISSWGVVIASFFWGWLWGPIGMIVAVPLTVCFVVIGRRVPQFSFFTKLLGSGAVLSPEGKLYQRLLAWDEIGASEIISKALGESDSAGIADSLLAPVLEALKQDLQTGDVTIPQAQFATRVIEDACGPLEEVEDSSTPTLLCISAQSIMDDSAARLLTRLTQTAGYPSASVTSATLASEAINLIHSIRPSIVAIVQVRPFSLAHSTYLLKSIRKQTEAQHVIVLCLDRQPLSDSIQLRFTQNGAEKVLTSFASVLALLAERDSLAPSIAEPAIEDALATSE